MILLWCLRNWQGLAVGAGIALLTAYPVGWLKGKEAGRVAQLQESVKAYQTREGIENEIAGDDAVALCIRLGGVPDDCNKLRGVAKNAKPR